MRSDTVTRPSAAMRRAMAEAETGDDVLREDPTVLRLEGRAAELTGKEAALFTPSGTFANQLALFTWVPRGREVYLNEYSHIVQHETGIRVHLDGARLFNAAAGLVALEEERPRLGEDHGLARELAAAFGALDEVFEVLTPEPQINMVFLRLRRPGAAAEGRFMELIEKAGILTYGPDGGMFRFVTHRDVDYTVFRRALAELPSIAEELRAA